MLNKYWTSVLKRVGILFLLIIFTLLSFKLAVFYMPFVFAFVVSLIIEPIIKFFMNKFKFSRKVSSIVVFIITFGIIIGLVVWVIFTLISESSDLLLNINDYYNKANGLIQKVVDRLNSNNLNIPSNISDILKNNSLIITKKLSSYIQEFLTKFLSAFSAIPNFAICFAVTILALYFMCTDRIYMLDELEYHLPKKWIKELTKHIRELAKTLGGYLKAQLILILISFIICLIGLYILYFLGLNVGFPLIIALVIAFVDALPILGSGTIMVPWAVISSLNGDLKLGISIVVLWIIMSIVRQFVEPKIVSGNIGIHPIFTIIAMYTGFKFIGVIGMFVGPIILIVLKNIFSNFLEGGIFKMVFEESFVENEKKLN